MIAAVNPKPWADPKSYEPCRPLTARNAFGLAGELREARAAMARRPYDAAFHPVPTRGAMCLSELAK
jgi:hypothetical protein